MLNQISLLLYLFSFISSHYLRSSTEDSSTISHYLSVNVPINGNSHSWHYYYIDLYIGDSLNKQSYLIDTSTSITTSPCHPFSKSTGQHQNGYYVVEEASVVKCKNDQDASCKFTRENAEGAKISGIYTKQVVRFNKDDAKPAVIPIGCTVNEEGFFYYQKADGIIGLANNEDSIINQLYKEGKINKRLFSLCFSQNGGYFTIGNINHSFHINSPIYFPITMKGVYALNINSVYLNFDNRYELHDLPAILDSGTTLTYFPSELSKFIIDNFKAKCNSELCGKYIKDDSYGHCFTFENVEQLNNAVVNLWPSIKFILNGNYNFVWKPINYVFNITKGEEVKACLGFEETKLEKIILGTTWMHGYEVIFDLDKSMIGFASADCNKGMHIIEKEESGVIEQSKKEVEELESKKEIQKEKENKEIKYRPLPQRRPQKEESNSNGFLYIVIGLLILVIVLLGYVIYKLQNGEDFLCLSIKRPIDYVKHVEVELEKQ